MSWRVNEDKPDWTTIHWALRFHLAPLSLGNICISLTQHKMEEQVP